MGLIDKIKAEVEKKTYMEQGFRDEDSEYGYRSCARDILSFLDTIEVEVDLENLFQALPEKIADEKSHQVYELSIYHYDGQCFVDYVGEIDHDSLYTFNGNTLYEAIEKAWNWLHKNSTGG